MIRQLQNLIDSPNRSQKIEAGNQLITSRFKPKN
jgi:hypothetical protein